MISMFFILGFCWSFSMYLTWFDLTSFDEFFLRVFSHMCLHLYREIFGTIQNTSLNLSRKQQCKTFSHLRKLLYYIFIFSCKKSKKIMIDIYQWYGFCNVGADPLLHLSGLWHFWQWEVLEVQPPTIDPCLITSLSHVFTNPESTNFQKI